MNFGQAARGFEGPAAGDGAVDERAQRLERLLLTVVQPRPVAQVEVRQASGGRHVAVAQRQRTMQCVEDDPRLRVLAQRREGVELRRRLDPLPGGYEGVGQA